MCNGECDPTGGRRTVSGMRRSAPLVLLIAVLVVVLVHGRGGDDEADAFGQGQVVRVVDGDTIRVRLGDRTERVRYIGIDTPESVKPGTPVQCYAKAASVETDRLLDGRQVRLRFDAERRDRYGRLLA